MLPIVCRISLAIRLTSSFVNQLKPISVFVFSGPSQNDVFFGQNTLHGYIVWTFGNVTRQLLLGYFACLHNSEPFRVSTIFLLLLCLHNGGRTKTLIVLAVATRS